MYNRYQNIFPQNSNYFPMTNQSQLISNAISEVKTITQAPEEMIYLTAISAVSFALQASINVEMPIGKVSPVSLMALTIAESGERKSSVENLLTKGIKSFQSVSVETYKYQYNKYKIQLDLHKQKTAIIKKSINFNDQMKYEEILTELIEHESKIPEKPKLPMLIFEDSTQEALLSDLHENKPNAFLSSSEGGILLNSRVMSQTANLNSIWSGDDVTVNRKTEESFTLNNARLTTHIMTQKSAFDRFMSKSKDDSRGNGFLSRFLVCAPLPTSGRRFSQGIDYSTEGLKLFNERLHTLLLESSKSDCSEEKKIVRFSNEAKNLWFEIYNDIEGKMGINGVFNSVKDHASKLPENIARLAALIHVFDNSSEDHISVDTLRESINLMGYFSNQFLNIFCVPPKYVTDANNLNHWLGIYLNSGIRYIKRNNILQFGPTGTRKKKDLDAALDYLKPSGCINEFISHKTRVIDLYPHLKLDEIKLKCDLSLGLVL